MARAARESGKSLPEGGMRVLSLISQTSLLGMEGASAATNPRLPKMAGMCFGKGQRTQHGAIGAGRAGALTQPPVFVTGCHSMSTEWHHQHLGHSKRTRLIPKEPPNPCTSGKRDLKQENSRTLPQPLLGHCPGRLQPGQDLAPGSSTPLVPHSPLSPAPHPTFPFDIIPLPCAAV